MRPSVSLEVEGVVEAFATNSAVVALHVAVALHVSFEHSGLRKGFATQCALEILLRSGLQT